MHVPQGKILHNHGEEIRCLYYVVEGLLEARMGTFDGAEKIMVRLGPGCTHGETYLLDPEGPSEVMLVAAEDSVVRVLSRRLFLELCRDADFTTELLRCLSRKARHMVRHVYGLSFGDAK